MDQKMRVLPLEEQIYETFRLVLSGKGRFILPFEELEGILKSAWKETADTLFPNEKTETTVYVKGMDLEIGVFKASVGKEGDPSWMGKIFIDGKDISHITSGFTVELFVDKETMVTLYTITNPSKELKK